MKDNGWNESWMRSVVPAGYAEATLELVGTAPLLMHSGEYDPDSETYRSYRLLGQKRGKSLDDEARLRELEWTLGIYFDDEIGPYIPSKNVKELLRAAATKYRKGEEIKRSLIVVSTRIPLEYEGPRDLAALWEQGFRYTTMVANGGPSRGRVQRCRPCFRGWKLTAEIAYDPEELDYDFLSVVAERSQKYGLGDYKPTFGAFAATLTKGTLHKAASNGKGSKRRDPDTEQAHEAFEKRIKVVGANSGVTKES